MNHEHFPLTTRSERDESEIWSFLIWSAFIGLVVGMLSGCGAAPEDTRTAPSALLYAVDAELSEAFLAATDRIYAASGIELEEGVEGTPLIQVPYNGDPACANTYVTFLPKTMRVVDVHIEMYPQRVDCKSVTIVLHELIHSLRRDITAELGGQNDDHAVDGVFHSHGGNGRITEASLVSVCATGLCSTFSPEH